MKPHIHSELIKSWADGAIIEVWNPDNEEWVELKGYFAWFEEKTYRVKPEQKPDVVKYASIDSHKLEKCDLTFTKYVNDNVKLTFDSETGKLKSAEVLE